MAGAIKRTVLIVDDQKVNRVVLQKMLSDEYDLLEAENGQQALDVLQNCKQTVAAVLLDLMMPIMSGFEFLTAVRGTPLGEIPIMVMTGSNDEKQEERVLELGAWDFISKPYNTKTLKFRLSNAIARSKLVSYERLKYLAEIDPLTGIYNKNKFFEATHEMLRLNSSETYVFIRFDIEKFKLINSFFGEKAGDTLLITIAQELEKYAVAQTFPMTYGHLEADVFGVCMPFTSEDTTVKQLMETREKISGYDLGFDIVPAFGLCVVTDPDMPISEIYNKAILAVKHCKGNYMMTYAFYTPDMSQDLIREQVIVNKMKSALKNHEFQVYLQPKYDLHNNMIAGAEALVRWQDPERGLISPGEFIPVFERNGFITQLDYYMWESVCILLRRWLDEGKQPMPISVNVSRVSLYNPKIADMLLELIKRYRISPALLQLELTESAYNNNPQGIRDMMKKLQQNGFSILMDDFGSGYSSLNVLKDLAVDVLKIDMCFMS